jgi:hypothetical protein
MRYTSVDLISYLLPGLPTTTTIHELYIYKYKDLELYVNYKKKQVICIVRSTKHHHSDVIVNMTNICNYLVHFHHHDCGNITHPFLPDSKPLINISKHVLYICWFDMLFTSWFTNYNNNSWVTMFSRFFLLLNCKYYYSTNTFNTGTIYLWSIQT